MYGLRFHAWIYLSRFASLKVSINASRDAEKSQVDQTENDDLPLRRPQVHKDRSHKPAREIESERQAWDLHVLDQLAGSDTALETEIPIHQTESKLDSIADERVETENLHSDSGSKESLQSKASVVHKPGSASHRRDASNSSLLPNKRPESPMPYRSEKSVSASMNLTPRYKRRSSWLGRARLRRLGY